MFTSLKINLSMFKCPDTYIMYFDIVWYTFSKRKCSACKNKSMLYRDPFLTGLSCVTINISNTIDVSLSACQVPICQGLLNFNIYLLNIINLN